MRHTRPCLTGTLQLWMPLSSDARRARVASATGLSDTAVHPTKIAKYVPYVLDLHINPSTPQEHWLTQIPRQHSMP